MYYLYGLQYIIKQFSELLLKNRNICNLENLELNEAYHSLLLNDSILSKKVDWKGSMIINFNTLKKYASTYHQNNEHFFINNSPKLEKRINSNYFMKALRALMKQEEIFQLSQFLIKIIVVNHLKTYTNGTTNDMLGISIIDFKDNFEEIDFIELVFHQCIHMIAFLSDRLIPHMSEENKIVQIPTTLQFVLGGNNFPAYLAFHSYLVGIEMLLFRESTNTLESKTNYHGSTKRILRIVKEFKHALKTNKELFTNYGNEILLRSFEEQERIERSYVCLN